MNGLLALLGLGAVAYYKYKNSSPEKQQEVKDKLNNAKENVNKWTGSLKSKANEMAGQVSDKAEELKNDSQELANS